MTRRKAVVMGLGLFGGGVGVTRYLAREGYDVTVTDLASPETLAPSVEQLEGVSARFVLGRHEAVDFEEADVVVANPAVPLNNDLLTLAKKAGATITSEIELFCDLCRAPMFGITGTAGKTTTSRLLTAVLAEVGRDVHLGGNVGVSLLDRVEEFGSDQRVVLELSSFQLERLPTKPRFAGAIILPITPNHLDRHADFEEYVEAKARLVDGLLPDAPLVIDAACDVATSWRKLGRLDAARALAVDDAACENVPRPRRLLGSFNHRNLAYAATLAGALDDRIGPSALARVAESFEPLIDRLEPVVTIAGVLFVNDSKATTPDAAAAAVQALGGHRIHLIAGGYDKGLELGPLVAAASQCASVLTIGHTGPRLAAAVGSSATQSETLERAVEEAANRARDGEIVLLSPGHASFDQFPNYADRGHVFRELAQALAR